MRKKVTLSRQGNFIYVDLATSQEKTLYRLKPQDASGSPNLTPRQIESLPFEILLPE